MKHSALWSTSLTLCILTSTTSGTGLLAPKGDSLDPGRRYVWVYWDAQDHTETLIIQPTLTTSASTIGVIIPTPQQPTWVAVDNAFFIGLTLLTKLDEQPKALKGKYRRLAPRSPYPRNADLDAIWKIDVAPSTTHLIVPAADTETVNAWFKEYNFAYAPREATLTALARETKMDWFLTLVTVDVTCLPNNGESARHGAVAPIGLTFRTPWPVYPSRLDPANSENPVEFRLFVHAPTKMDLPEPLSYAHHWVSLLSKAKKKFKARNAPFPVDMQDLIQTYERHRQAYTERAEYSRSLGLPPAQLLFGKWLTDVDITNAALGRRPQRDLPPGGKDMLRSIAPHLEPSWYLTVIAKVFTQRELREDFPLWAMDASHIVDRSEHTFVLPAERPFRGRN